MNLESYLKRYVRENLLTEKRNRFFNWGKLKKLSKCIGLIGPRGSCKSVAAAAIGILDGLVPGFKVISNMAIKWGVKLGDYIVGYASEDLDKAALLNFDIDSDVWIVVDEVNIEFSEARRSTTNRNLIFNKILQQLRKRKLNLIYTTQHEMWIDNRLRFQTDVFIKTRDICLQPGGIYLPYEFGEWAEWNIYDMAGILGKGSYADHGIKYAQGLRFNARRWWNTFDTLEIQGEDESIYGKGQFGQMEYQQTEEAKNMGWIWEKVQHLIENYEAELDKRYEISEADMMAHLDVDPADWKKVTEYLSKVLKIRMRNSAGYRKFMLAYWVAKYKKTRDAVLV